MRISYIKLINSAGIYAGMGQTELEVDFHNSMNTIIAITGKNGNGKTVFLSTCHPFSSISGLDERSTLPFILKNKTGYKEIRYSCGEDVFIIKHHYKPNTTGSHAVKSYISKNGTEMNENGNVSSFLMLVETYFGITPEMMRLIRLGSNVNSFVSQSAADRKKYVGRLIEEIDAYMQVHKKLSADMKIVKVLMSTNATNLSKSNITDIITEERQLSELGHRISDLDGDKNKTLLAIQRIQALERENDLDELIKRRRELEASLYEFEKTESEMVEHQLLDVDIQQLIDKRKASTDKKNQTQSRIDSLRMTIDAHMQQIDRLKTAVQRITANNDLQSLLHLIQELQTLVSAADGRLLSLNPTCTSEELNRLIFQLESFNQVGSMIYTLGNKPLILYLKLVSQKKQVETFIREQSQLAVNNMSKRDVTALMDHIFQDDGIIMPSCDTEYVDCPYYRLSTVIREYKDKIDDERYDEETLQYLKTISSNVDRILTGTESLLHVNIPDGFKEILREDSILARLSKRLHIFDLSELQEYHTMVREYEVLLANKMKLGQCERELAAYRSSGVDTQLSEIKHLEDTINSYRSDIDVLRNSISTIDAEISLMDRQIGLVTRYSDGRKYRSILDSNLRDINKTLIPLEEAGKKKIELSYQLSSQESELNRLRQDHRTLERHIQEYRRLIKEADTLKEKYSKLEVLIDSVSTTKGIPLIFMERYIGSITGLANSLLDIIYDGELYLKRFDIDTFEFPFVKNGNTVDDIKYGSQSELAMMTMALSFALAHNATGLYNILLLDEIDSGLDDVNRAAFLKMLYRQMQELNSEQVFMISHNLSSMTTIPMDVICLGESNNASGLQNVIFEQKG